jgi:DNA polymerase-3 subunit epsilon
MRLAPRRPVPACVLAELGRCGAPCDGRESADEYAVHVEAVRHAMTHDADEVTTRTLARLRQLAEAERFEDAAVLRDRLLAFLRAAARSQRLIAFAGVPQLVAAAPGRDGTWELVVVRYGRLAAAGNLPPGAAAVPVVDALVASAETVTPDPAPSAGAEESELLLRWLARPGTRLARVEGTWASPVPGAARWHEQLNTAAVRTPPLE